MLERSERTLRIACICLAALLLYQFVRLVVRRDPLANLSIPALPSLPPAAGAQAASNQTNSPSHPSSSKSGSNSLASEESGKKETNAILSAQTQTNSISSRLLANSVSNALPGQESEKLGTNLVSEKVLVKTETNSVTGQGQPKPGTNSLASQELLRSGTNAVSDQKSPSPATASISPPRSGSSGMRSGSPPAMAMMGMNPMGRQGPGMRGPPLPPAMQARVDRIIDSEILAPVIRPLPMALLGIAGKDVFLRAPNGQTGLVKEGGELGGVKLLRIGINRVLVEQDGQKKELTIFSGFGSESLLPKEKETPK